MFTPRIEINLKKIAHNTKHLIKVYASKGIEVMGVTKSVCGNPRIASILVKSGIKILADSRLMNIRLMRNAGIKAEFLLLRIPSLSQTESVIKYADISLNSEYSVIKKLAKYAAEQNTVHKIILMVELGDLREGILPEDLENIIEKVMELKSIELIGIATNLACFGGIKPDENKMNNLSSIAENLEQKYGFMLEIISGGNSANYNWFISEADTGKINNLRLGESIFLGNETIHRKVIPNLYTDAFTLVAEVIELKIKPSLPYGISAQDAFGNIPNFNDVGKINRAILNVGIQDVAFSGLTPRLDIKIIGASSDHIIVDTRNTKLKVGDKVEFDLNYAALLSAMTSPYVFKKIELSLWTGKNIVKVLNKNTASIKMT